MRKTLSALALLALATVASANSLSQGSAYTTATFTATDGLTLNSVTDQEYNFRVAEASDPTQHYQFTPGVNFLDLDASAIGDYVPTGPNGATAQLGTNTTYTLVGNRVSLSAESQLQLAPTATTNVVAEANLGHRVFLTFTNPTAAVGHVTFNLQVLQSCLAHADVPLGNGPYGIADYADPTAFGGVSEVSFDANGGIVVESQDSRSLDVNTGNGDVDLFDTLHASFSDTYDIAPNSSQTYGVYAVVDADTVHANPVPEPPALGLGALGLLRRRKRA